MGIATSHSTGPVEPWQFPKHGVFQGLQDLHCKGVQLVSSEADVPVVRNLKYLGNPR